MKNLKRVLNNLKYSLPAFIYLVYMGAEHNFLFASVRPEIRYTLFLLDYKIGFCSRMLLGSVIQLFTDNITTKMIDVIYTVVCLVVFALISVLAGVVLNRAEKPDRRYLLFVAVFLILSPCSVYPIAGLRGLYDLFWILLALICVFCLKSGKTAWLVPVLCFLGLAVHYNFLTTYIPAIFLILLFRWAGKPEKKNGILFGATFGVSFVSSVYFVFFANNTVRMSSDEVFSYLSAKLPGVEIFRTYVDQYLFYSNKGVEYKTLPEKLSAILEFNSTISTPGEIVKYLFLVLPLIAFFVAVWVLCFRSCKKDKARGKYLKWLYLLCAVTPLVYIVNFVLSPDYNRWTSHLLISGALVFFYNVLAENRDVTDAMKRIFCFLSSNPLLVVLYIVACLYVH